VFKKGTLGDLRDQVAALKYIPTQHNIMGAATDRFVIGIVCAYTPIHDRVIGLACWEVSKPDLAQEFSYTGI